MKIAPNTILRAAALFLLVGAGILVGTAVSAHAGSATGSNSGLGLPRQQCQATQAFFEMETTSLPPTAPKTFYPVTSLDYSIGRAASGNAHFNSMHLNFSSAPAFQALFQSQITGTPFNKVVIEYRPTSPTVLVCRRLTLKLVAVANLSETFNGGSMDSVSLDYGGLQIADLP